MTESSEEAEDYIAPPIFKFVARLLTRPRAEYSLDVARYVTTGYSSEASDYQAGLIFIACLVGGGAFLWLFVILVLKLKGRQVGCASGRGFERRNRDNMERGVSTDVESDQSSPKNDDSRLPKRRATENDDLSMLSSLPSILSIVENGSCYTNESEASAPSRRERRTQVCFLLFGAIALLCVPMIMIFSYAPLRHTSEQSEDYLQMTSDLVDQVQSSLAAVTIASEASNKVANRLKLNISNACPDLSSSQPLGGVQSMVNLFSNDYYSLQEGLVQHLSEVTLALNETDLVVDYVDTLFTTTSIYLWLIPLILLIFSVFVGASMFGVIVSWRGESSRKIQRWLSYCVLPMIIVYSISCWAMAATLSIATAIGSDSCLYGSLQSGSPANTIGAILRYTDNSPNSTFSHFVNGYTAPCESSTSINLLEKLTMEVNSLISAIASELSAFDSANQSLVQMCGSDGLNDFFRGSSDLGKLLIVVRKALESSIRSLSCRNVRPIYVHVVEESLCSDAANAAAVAFLLFLLLGTSTLVMITLRAAWTQPIQEQKILKDDEIAENMIVDEHEEYLAYISKYKHEWQEYRGFDSALPCDPGPDFIGDGEGSESEQSIDEVRDIIPLALTRDQMPRNRDLFDPYNGWDTRSHSTAGDISFPSLRSQIEFPGKKQTTLGTLLAPKVPIDLDDGSELDGMSVSPVNEGREDATICNESMGGYSLQTDIVPLVSRKHCSDLDDSGPVEHTGEQGFNVKPVQRNSPNKQRSALAPTSPQNRREHFFPSSPKKTSERTSANESTIISGRVRDYHARKSELILLEMEAIGATGPLEQMAISQTPARSGNLKGDNLTPTSAVTKMNQQSSPIPVKQVVEYGKSVRLAATTIRPRAARQRTGHRGVLDRPGPHNVCAPSSYSQVPLKMDQYPKAYETAANDKPSSPPSTPPSTRSSKSGDPDWLQFLRA